MSVSAPEQPAPLPPSNSAIDDLDAELEAIFDNPAAPPVAPIATDAAPLPTTSPPPLVSLVPSLLPTSDASPAVLPKPVVQRTIVTALLANKAHVTGPAAVLAAEMLAEATNEAHEVSPGFAVTARLPIAQAMMQRRASKDTPSAAEAAAEQKRRARRARNAFKVVGRNRLGEPQGRDARETYAYLDADFTNMALRDALFPQHAMKALFEHFLRVDVAEITSRDDEMRAGKLGEFVVFACLVRKHAKKEAKNGRKYAVWSVCNMPRGKLPGSNAIATPTMVTVLLFDAAFEAFHRKVEGSVFALRKPSLLPPRGSETGSADVRNGAEWSGHCLSVSKEEQAIELGVCKDLKLCEVPSPNGSVCSTWYDANRMQQCAHHMRVRRKRMISGVRMDVNNAERPNFPRHVTHNAQEPSNISVVARIGGRGEEKEEEGDNELVKAKRKEDRIKTQRLQMAFSVKRREEALALARKSKNGTVASRIRAAADNSRREGSKLAVARGGRFQMIVKQKSLQRRYEEAVEFLVECGFSLGYDGSLKAPDEGAGQLALKRRKVYARPDGKGAASSGVDAALRNLGAWKEKAGDGGRIEEDTGTQGEVDSAFDGTHDMKQHGSNDDSSNAANDKAGAAAGAMAGGAADGTVIGQSEGVPESLPGGVGEGEGVSAVEGVEDGLRGTGEGDAELMELSDESEED